MKSDRSTTGKRASNLGTPKKRNDEGVRINIGGLEINTFKPQDHQLTTTLDKLYNC